MCTILELNWHGTGLRCEVLLLQYDDTHNRIHSHRSSSGIAVKSQRVWGHTGYTREAPSLPVATATPTEQSTTDVSEREEEGESREETKVMEDIGSTSQPITAVSSVV